MKISRFRKAKRCKFAGVPVKMSRKESERMQREFNRMIQREIENIRNNKQEQ